jgi:hypothetical protein
LQPHAPLDRSTDDRAAPLRAFARRAGVVLFVTTLIASGVSGAGAPGPEDDGPPATTSQAVPMVPTAEAPADALPVTSHVARDPDPVVATRPVLDPSARLLSEDDASEAWTLFLELESGHRITQRFLLTNVGPGEHSAVAVGHLVEPGRAPYRYENGRRRARWTLSDDRLFFDIAASHLDLHRPKGELRITKDDIEIRMFFDFPPQGPSGSVPEALLPPDYHVDVLALGAATTGSILAPWMTSPVETRGRAWLVHTWTSREEARLLSRRLEVFGANAETSFYGIQLRGNGDWTGAWSVAANGAGQMIESPINVRGAWRERTAPQGGNYPTPAGFDVDDERFVGPITLDREWLRFDPLEVIPQPFRWFIRRRSRPQEVWADARIGVSLSSASGTPSLPFPDETTSASATETSRAKRETDEETSLLPASGSSNGVASITFLNPVGRR